MPPTYMICDDDGYTITDGLQQHESRRVAQSIADRRLESVWLSESQSQDFGEEFEPDGSNPLIAARLALKDWEPEADTQEIAEVFAVIFERQPDDDEDAISAIYAAENTLTAAQAQRIIKVI